MTEKIIYAVAALVIVSFTAVLGWRHFHPQERGCARSIALCKPPDSEKSAKQCREVLTDIGQRLGGSIERMAAQCMLDSENCNESLACLSHADRRANALKK
jgi:hypothetical protein